MSAHTEPLLDTAPSWESPFGGFVVGRDDIGSAEESIKRMFNYEYLTNATEKAIVQDYIDAELKANAEVKSYAWEDASPGGCSVINPLWQFCEDDDLVPEQLGWPGTSGFKGIEGMGETYAEMYYQNQRVLWLTVGMPRYNTLRSFYKHAVDRKLSNWANSASLSWDQKIGMVAGEVVGLAIGLPLMVANAVITAFRNIGDGIFADVNRYYEMVPAMHRYYKIVNTILATIYTHLRFTPQLDEIHDKANGGTGKYQVDDLGDNAAFSKAYNEYNATFDNEIIKAGPDIVAILSRRHVLRANLRGQIFQSHTQAMLNGTVEIRTTSQQTKVNALNFKTMMSNTLSEFKQKMQRIPIPEYTKKLEEFFDKEDKVVTNNPEQAPETGETADEGPNIFDPLEGATTIEDHNWEYFKGVALGNLQWIGIRLEQGEAASESLSSSTGPSEIASQLKSMSSASRSAKFNFMSGKTGIVGLDGILKAAGTAFEAVGSALGIASVTSALKRGAGHLDIPDVWSDSRFSRSVSFDVRLASHYGDKISIYQSVLMPYAMIMGFSFPLGIGANAYTSPLLVQGFCPGTTSFTCGVVTSVNIKRGLPEHGWTLEDLPKVIELSITIQDMATAMFISVGDAHVMAAFRKNTTFHDYLATLSGISLNERSNIREMFIKKLNVSRLLLQKNYFNANMLVHKIGSSNLLRRGAQVFAPRKSWQPDF